MSLISGSQYDTGAYVASVTHKIEHTVYIT